MYALIPPESTPPNELAAVCETVQKFLYEWSGGNKFTWNLGIWDADKRQMLTGQLPKGGSCIPVWIDLGPCEAERIEEMRCELLRHLPAEWRVSTVDRKSQERGAK